MTSLKELLIQRALDENDGFFKIGMQIVPGNPRRVNPLHYWGIPFALEKSEARDYGITISHTSKTEHTRQNESVPTLCQTDQEVIGGSGLLSTNAITLENDLAGNRLSEITNSCNLHLKDQYPSDNLMTVNYENSAAAEITLPLDTPVPSVNTEAIKTEIPDDNLTSYTCMDNEHELENFESTDTTKEHSDSQAKASSEIDNFLQLLNRCSPISDVLSPDSSEEENELLEDVANHDVSNSGKENETRDQLTHAGFDPKSLNDDESRADLTEPIKDIASKHESDIHESNTDNLIIFSLNDPPVEQEVTQVRENDIVEGIVQELDRPESASNPENMIVISLNGDSSITLKSNNHSDSLQCQVESIRKDHSIPIVSENIETFEQDKPTNTISLQTTKSYDCSKQQDIANSLIQDDIQEIKDTQKQNINVKPLTSKDNSVSIPTNATCSEKQVETKDLEVTSVCVASKKKPIFKNRIKTDNTLMKTFDGNSNKSSCVKVTKEKEMKDKPSDAHEKSSNVKDQSDKPMQDFPNINVKHASIKTSGSKENKLVKKVSASQEMNNNCNNNNLSFKDRKTSKLVDAGLSGSKNVKKDSNLSRKDKQSRKTNTDKAIMLSEKCTFDSDLKKPKSVYKKKDCANSSDNNSKRKDMFDSSNVKKCAELESEIKLLQVEKKNKPLKSLSGTHVLSTDLGKQKEHNDAKANDSANIEQKAKQKLKDNALDIEATSSVDPVVLSKETNVPLSTKEISSTHDELKQNAINLGSEITKSKSDSNLKHKRKKSISHVHEKETKGSEVQRKKDDKSKLRKKTFSVSKVEGQSKSECNVTKDNDGQEQVIDMTTDTIKDCGKVSNPDHKGGLQVKEKYEKGPDISNESISNNEKVITYKPTYRPTYKCDICDDVYFTSSERLDLHHKVTHKMLTKTSQLPSHDVEKKLIDANIENNTQKRSNLAEDFWSKLGVCETVRDMLKTIIQKKSKNDATKEDPPAINAEAPKEKMKEASKKVLSVAKGNDIQKSKNIIGCKDDKCLEDKLSKFKGEIFGNEKEKCVVKRRVNISKVEEKPNVKQKQDVNISTTQPPSDSMQQTVMDSVNSAHPTKMIKSEGTSNPKHEKKAINDQEIQTDSLSKDKYLDDNTTKAEIDSKVTCAKNGPAMKMKTRTISPYNDNRIIKINKSSKHSVYKQSSKVNRNSPIRDLRVKLQRNLAKHSLPVECQQSNDRKRHPLGTHSFNLGEEMDSDKDSIRVRTDSLSSVDSLTSELECLNDPTDMEMDNCGLGDHSVNKGAKSYSRETNPHSHGESYLQQTHFSTPKKHNEDSKEDTYSKGRVHKSDDVYRRRSDEKNRSRHASNSSRASDDAYERERRRHPSVSSKGSHSSYDISPGTNHFGKLETSPRSNSKRRGSDGIGSSNASRRLYTPKRRRSNSSDRIEPTSRHNEASTRVRSNSDQQSYTHKRGRSRTPKRRRSRSPERRRTSYRHRSNTPDQQQNSKDGHNRSHRQHSKSRSRSKDRGSKRVSLPISGSKYGSPSKKFSFSKHERRSNISRNVGGPRINTKRAQTSGKDLSAEKSKPCSNLDSASKSHAHSTKTRHGSSNSISSDKVRIGELVKTNLLKESEELTKDVTCEYRNDISEEANTSDINNCENKMPQKQHETSAGEGPVSKTSSVNEIVSSSKDKDQRSSYADDKNETKDPVNEIRMSSEHKEKVDIQEPGERIQSKETQLKDNASVRETTVDEGKVKAQNSENTNETNNDSIHELKKVSIPNDSGRENDTSFESGNENQNGMDIDDEKDVSAVLLISCLKCGKEFESTSKLHKHLFNAHLGVFKCRLCRLGFHTPTEHYNHMKSQLHMPVQKIPFTNTKEKECKDKDDVCNDDDKTKKKVSKITKKVCKDGIKNDKVCKNKESACTDEDKSKENSDKDTKGSCKKSKEVCKDKENVSLSVEKTIIGDINATQVNASQVNENEIQEKTSKEDGSEQDPEKENPSKEDSSEQDPATICLICKQAFDVRIDLVDHLWNIHRKRIKVRPGNRDFINPNKKDSVSKHDDKPCEGNDKPVYRNKEQLYQVEYRQTLCFVCNVSFDTRIGLVDHAWIEHRRRLPIHPKNKNNKSLQQQQHRPPSEGNTLSKEPIVNGERSQKDNGEDATEVDKDVREESEGNEKVPTRPHDRQKFCFICKTSFGTRVELVDHLWEQHGKKVFNRASNFMASPPPRGFVRSRSPPWGHNRVPMFSRSRSRSPPRRFNRGQHFSRSPPPRSGRPSRFARSRSRSPTQRHERVSRFDRSRSPLQGPSRVSQGSESKPPQQCGQSPGYDPNLTCRVCSLRLKNKDDLFKHLKEKHNIGTYRSKGDNVSLKGLQHL